MLIVCAVLATLVGMSWPAMRGMLNRARMQQASDELQSVLRKTRTQAVRNEVATVFQYEPGGRRYRTGDWDTLLFPHGGDEPGSVADGEGTAAGALREVARPERGTVQRELPEGVRFAPAMNGLQAPLPGINESAGPEALAASDDSREPEWGDAITFLANGRSENADIQIVDDRQFVVEIHLRGLTGVVTASAPRKAETGPDEPPVSTGEGQEASP